MRIGELAERSGLSRDSLRFYEQRGLLQSRRLPNGYRDYPEEAVQWLAYVRTAQELGFTLAEIAVDLPRLAGTAHPDAAIRDALASKLKDIDTRIAALQGLRDELTRRLSLGAACPLRPATD